MIKVFRQNKRLIKSFSGYTIANLLNASLPFLLLPILTSYLDLKNYGILSNLNSLISILIPLVGINITSAISKQYFNKDIELIVYLTTTIKTILKNSVLFFILIYFLSSWIESITKIPRNYIIAIPFYALFSNLIEVLLTIIRMEEKPILYGVFRIFRTTIELGVTLLLIIYYDYGWAGQFFGLITAGTIGVIISIYCLIKYDFLDFKIPFNKSYYKQFLNFGIPLIPHALSGTIILYSDKLIITNLIGVEENGLYSAAFQIGMIISLFQNSFNQAWVPFFYKQLATSFNKKKIVIITYSYFIVLLLLVFSLWLLTPFIFSFLSNEYQGGMSFVFWIGLGFGFNGMYKMMVNYLFYLELTKIIAFTTFTIALCNIALNILFIQLYGLIGAAIASSISFGLEFLFIWYLSNKYYPMPWFSIFKKK